MQNPKISVIMPIYNTEEYLEETLISLVNQTIIDEIEVIMIDDGSTDGSKYIIDRYALDYNNFFAYHKENEGQSITRNYGLKLAKGEYCAFLDSDDYIPPDAYETLYNLAVKNNSDVAVGNVLRFGLYNVWEDNLFKKSFFGLNDTIESTTLNEMPSLVWDTITCNKLYKKDFLIKNSIQFPNKKIIFEDIPFSLKTYILADSISITPNVTYYWRFRTDNTSATQQDKNIENFRNRLEITELVLDLIDEYNISDEIRNELYNKWINHDLKFNLKRIDSYEHEYQEEFISQTYDIVNVIPDDVIENQNSYKKVLFKMIKNKDFNRLLEFAPLENELYENPHIPSHIGDEYSNDFDFYQDLKNEELFVELVDASFDENNLYLKFSETLYYLSGDVGYNIEAKLIDSNGEYQIDVDLDEKQLIIPFDLIKDKNHLNVKLVNVFKDFKKEALMKNRHRQSINFDEFDVDLDMGVNSYLYIDIRHEKDNKILISDIAFNEDKFIITGTSKNKADAIIMENVIDFDKNTYPLKYGQDNHLFTFEIPYYDILNDSIKKWELNCESCENSIMLSQKFFFFKKRYRIQFLNSRNKILIENDIINPINTMEELSKVNDNLKQENNTLSYKNKKLTRQNKELNDTIQEFKSRKIVRLVDGIKRQ